eukprot:TRINITY_DN70151_c0_g1_i1.p1 TRINITY_DN70151_c0_g1~~TRINITY_DN70151_c0_g1_i1.p1  ORF type:complete len:356 (+),score=76.88 TRINITY_DN70151_c0_g1_i1:99-1070(+)
MPRLMYGAPSQHVSQWPMVPWFVIGFASTSMSLFMLDWVYQAIMRNFESQRWTGHRRGRIEEATYRGFGFWTVLYTFEVGPKRFIGSQVSAGATLGESMQFFFPYGRRWREFTTPGKEVDVYFARSGTGAAAPVLERVIPWEYMVGGTLAFAAILRTAYVSQRRFWMMMKLYALHNTEEGVQLLRRASVHQASGMPGPDPAHRWLHSVWPLNQYVTPDNIIWGGLSSYHHAVRSQDRASGRDHQYTVKENEQRVRAEELELAEAAAAGHANGTPDNACRRTPAAGEVLRDFSVELPSSPPPPHTDDSTAAPDPAPPSGSARAA